MRLPLELFDAIFELLANDPSHFDVDALKACSLTSTVISAICERHLYSCLYIYRESSKEEAYQQPDAYYPQCRTTIDKYMRILSNKPDIIRHVRRLGITILDHDLVESSMRGAWWQSLQQIMSNIPHDKVQWFKYYSANTAKLYPADSENIRGSIFEILKSPSLKGVHLYGAGTTIPLHYLLGRTSPAPLEELDIAFCRASPKDVDRRLLTSASVDSLTLRSVNPEAEDNNILTLCTPCGKPCLDVTSLSSLSIVLSRQPTFRTASVKSARTLLGSTKAIKTLTLHSSNHFMDIDAQAMELATAVQDHTRRTLQKLALVWTPKSDSLFTSIPDFLRFKEKFIELKEIELQLLFPLDIDSGSPWTESGWNDIATVLSDTAVFPALHKVGIHIASVEPTAMSESLCLNIKSGRDIVTRAMHSIGVLVEFNFATNHRLSYSNSY